MSFPIIHFCCCSSSSSPSSSFCRMYSAACDNHAGISFHSEEEEEKWKWKKRNEYAELVVERNDIKKFTKKIEANIIISSSRALCSHQRKFIFDGNAVSQRRHNDDDDGDNRRRRSRFIRAPVWMLKPIVCVCSQCSFFFFFHFPGVSRTESICSVRWNCLSSNHSSQIAAVGVFHYAAVAHNVHILVKLFITVQQQHTHTRMHPIHNSIVLFFYAKSTESKDMKENTQCVCGRQGGWTRFYGNYGMSRN